MARNVFNSPRMEINRLKDTRDVGRGHILSNPCLDDRHRRGKFEEAVFQGDLEERYLNVGRGHILNNPCFHGRHRPGMFEEAVFQGNLEEPYFDRRSLGWNLYRSDVDAPIHHLSKDEICKHCSRPASKECGVCAMPYCSRKCQLQDYNRHRLECVIPPLVDRKNLAHLKEILKEDNVRSKSQKGRNKDASNKLLEKDNSRKSMNGKSRQDSSQNQRDGTKKNNIERRSQNGTESRNGREKKLSNEVPNGIDLVMENGVTLNRKLNTFFAKKKNIELVHAPKKEIGTTECKTENSPAVEPQSKSLPAKESKSSNSSSTTHLLPSASTDKIYRMDEDLEFEGLPIGKTVELLVLHKFTETDFTCCRRDSAALRYCLETLHKEITAFCNTCEEEYRPKEIGELCLAKFENDGMWYRAVCIEKTDDSAQKVKVVFIDFGNADDVAISHIRRMVAEYLKTPAVAHLCAIKGSEKMSEAKQDAIGSLVEAYSIYPASIIEKKSSSYVIEMLHVTKALSSIN